MLEVREIRRYPVKAMAGETLTSVDVDQRGLTGDRWYAVVDADGRFAAGKDSGRFRRRDRIFDYAAAGDCHVVVRRGDVAWRVGDRALDAELTRAMQSEVRVLPEGEVPHQDAGDVSIVGTASLQWCREQLEIDADRRRIRPNLVVATQEPFVEETWVGRELHLGGCALRVADRIGRCRVVDLAQDGVAATTPMLRALGREREVCLGVYADVVTPGRIRLGDPVVVDPV